MQKTTSNLERDIGPKSAGCFTKIGHWIFTLIAIVVTGSFGFILFWMIGGAMGFIGGETVVMAFFGLLLGGFLGWSFARKVNAKSKTPRLEDDPDTVDLITYQKFQNIDDALLLINTLKERGIVAVLTDTSPSLDANFISSTQREFCVKVKQSQYQVTNDWLDQKAKENLTSIPSEHYLHDFTDAELMEVIERSDEWSREDFLLSKQILNDRGTHIDEEQIERIKLKRYQELTQTERGEPLWLVIGFVSAILGGLPAIFIGLSYWKLQKNDPNGQKFYGYDEWTRNLGKWMFWIGILFSIAWFTVWIWR